jgi:hypothetical protein
VCVIPTTVCVRARVRVRVCLNFSVTLLVAGSPSSSLTNSNPLTSTLPRLLSPPSAISLGVSDTLSMGGNVGFTLPYHVGVNASAAAAAPGIIDTWHTAGVGGVPDPLLSGSSDSLKFLASLLEPNNYAGSHTYT